jgi:hypothetical protein
MLLGRLPMIGLFALVLSPFVSTLAALLLERVPVMRLLFTAIAVVFLVRIL